MSKFVEIFFVLLFCLLTSLTRLDQFAAYILCKLKGQIQRAIMFPQCSITLFHFYSFFFQFRHSDLLTLIKGYKRHLVTGRAMQTCQSFSKRISLPTISYIKITLMKVAFIDM